MIPVTIFAGRPVAVFGLGLSGIAAARSLAAGGAQVLAWDDGAAARAKAEAAGLVLSDLTSANWARIAALVLAPGVPLTHPEPHWTVERAQDAGVEVIGDTELFFRERAKLSSRSKVVVITGTNGKSTTTALTAHLLEEAGQARGAWRQYRQGRARASALRRRSDLRARAFDLPDRSHAVSGAERRRAPQHHPGSSRPPRHHRELCRHQGPRV